MLSFGKISSMAGNLYVVELRLCLFLALFAEYRGEHYIQGDRYIQVNFVENSNY